MSFVKKIIISVAGSFLIYVIVFLSILFFYFPGATKGEKINKSERDKSAVFVVDMQNKFTYYQDEKKMKEKKFDLLMDNINSALDVSGDAEKICIIQVFEEKSLLAFFMPFVPLLNSNDAKINSKINFKNALIFPKSKQDAFSNPSLDFYLERKKVGKIYITGIATEACVKSTVGGALNRGYEVFVVKEAVGSMLSEKVKEKMLKEYEKNGAKIISLDELKGIKL